MAVSHIKKVQNNVLNTFTYENIENKIHLPWVHFVFVSCVYFVRDWRCFRETFYDRSLTL